jgi:DNA (cytosine-5)-methyltransferase 1
MRYASVCDGIGAAHVAWKPLGWQCSWTSEIEPFPAAVVEHNFGFANVGDMTKITEEMLHEHGPVDLLVGGTPCQSFSVAGLRGGLADPRGNLALRFVQLAAVMQPKWIVWENVPGVLSSGKGRDFGTFLGALGELGYGFAYRVLDAQWFGVAQRRRRVFVVGHLGDWRRAAAVLFERDSVFGNPPTRGAKGQGSASGFADGSSGGLAKPLGSHALSKGRGTDLDNTTYVAFHHNAQAAQLPHAGRDTSVTDSLTCSQGAAVDFTAKDCGGDASQEVAPTMRAMGHSRSHANGGGQLAVAVDTYNQAIGDVSIPLRVGNAKDSLPAAMVPFTKSKRAQSTTDDETWVPGEVSPTMSCFDQGDTRATTVVAFKPGQSEAAGGTFVTEEFAPTIQGQNNGSTAVPAVAFANRTRDGIKVPEIMPDGIVPALTNPGGGGRSDAVNVAHAMAVRRLTPRECERLQGFPDDYTLVEYRKKLAADGPRYRALGNSMAVPVMRWIGERIAMVDRML